MHGGIRGAPKFPAAAVLRTAVARAAPLRRCRIRSRPSTSRSTQIARAASTIISAAASRATPSTSAGSCRISRRCSTTTRSSIDLMTQAWRETGSAALCAAHRRDRRLAAARDGRRGRRLRRVARCRQRGRGGQVLCLDARRDRRGAGRSGRRASSPRSTTSRAARQLGRPHHPQPARTRASCATPRRGASCRDAREAARAARASACAPAGTTRCWPTGTA